jgi:hypothetical protein
LILLLFRRPAFAPSYPEWHNKTLIFKQGGAGNSESGLPEYHQYL